MLISNQKTNNKKLKQNHALIIHNSQSQTFQLNGAPRSSPKSFKYNQNPLQIPKNQNRQYIARLKSESKRNIEIATHPFKCKHQHTKYKQMEVNETLDNDWRAKTSKNYQISPELTLADRSAVKKYQALCKKMRVATVKMKRFDSRNWEILINAPTFLLITLLHTPTFLLRKPI